jgi:hypothetical protein
MTYEGESDYRNGAGEFLRGTLFSHARFVPPDGWDHYHCECCNAKFMSEAASLRQDPAIQREGHTATIDGGHGSVVYWVCQECFDDLAAPFSWTTK